MKLKQLIWVGSSEKDLYKFPNDVIDTMVHGLRVAQDGKKAANAKVLKQGIKTSQRDMDLIESRLKWANEIYKEHHKKK